MYCCTLIYFDGKYVLYLNIMLQNCTLVLNGIISTEATSLSCSYRFIGVTDVGPAKLSEAE